MTAQGAQAMSTADWALVISLLSFVVSLFSLAWNVWSKFIYPKPKVQVTCGFMEIYVGGRRQGSVIALTAVNHGPIAVTLDKALVYKRAVRRKNRKVGLLNPLHNYPAQTDFTQGPYGGGLPKKMEVGEQFTVYLAPKHEGIADERFSVLGFNDTFDRTHWAPRKQLKELRKRIKEYIAETGSKQQAPPPS